MGGGSRFVAEAGTLLRIGEFVDATARASASTNATNIAELETEENALRLGQAGHSTEIAALQAKQLPNFPAAGSRDDKIPKFDGDVLGWEEDAGAGGGVAGPGQITPRLIATRTGNSEVTGYSFTLQDAETAIYYIANNIRAIVPLDTITDGGRSQLDFDGTGGRERFLQARAGRTITLSGSSNVNTLLIYGITIVGQKGDQGDPGPASIPKATNDDVDAVRSQTNQTDLNGICLLYTSPSPRDS